MCVPRPREVNVTEILIVYGYESIGPATIVDVVQMTQQVAKAHAKRISINKDVIGSQRHDTPEQIESIHMELLKRLATILPNYINISIPYQRVQPPMGLFLLPLQEEAELVKEVYMVKNEQ
ncbi:hypothetical protein HAX54_003038 [Datura stramonium]|uniref:Uncharacterized protein n=1 Tax=Datura stramonium TaxID=4076 RepID=A0ABS8WRV0_DATST|nr:hypothetical protein [Datura stramonium]